MQTSTESTTVAVGPSTDLAASVSYQPSPSGGNAEVPQPGAGSGTGRESADDDLAAPSPTDGSVSFIRPQFGASREVFAATARIAGRLNAAHISPVEVASLLQEHRSLVDKLVSGGITPREKNRLSYVRWSLDRIEDARFGAGLDVLENNIDRYETILHDVRILQDQLTEALNGGTKPKRKRSKR